MSKLILLFTIITTASSQSTDTILIDWSFGSTPEATDSTSRTIEVGDTVTWEMAAFSTHNVKSKPSATEPFESGDLGNGGTFSYTFTSVGSNEYECSVNPRIMYGTITVVAEGALSTCTGVDCREKECDDYNEEWLAECACTVDSAECVAKKNAWTNAGCASQTCG